MRYITKIIYIMCVCLCFAAQSQPGPFSLKQPYHLSADVSVRPTYSWEHPLGGDHYKIQVINWAFTQDWTANWVYQSPASPQIIFDYYTVMAKEPALPNDKRLLWRVVAYDINNKTRESNVYEFTTVKPRPPIPVLTSPSNGATVDRASVTLQWYSPGATKYYYRITTMSNNYLHAGFRITASNSVIFKGFAPGTKYYWSVMAGNSVGDCYWSGEYNFTTAVYSGPYEPNLAVTYAKEYTEPWINDNDNIKCGNKYNPAYFSYSGRYTSFYDGGCSWYGGIDVTKYCVGDCTNFVSQCLKAGGLNIPPNINQTSPVQIRSNERGTIYSVFDLRNWLQTVYNIVRPQNYEEGKDGVLPTKFTIEVGDIIQLGKVFITSPQVNDPYIHSVIVTKVTEPTSPSGIFVTAHDFDNEDKPLSAYYGQERDFFNRAYFHRMNEKDVGIEDRISITSGPTTFNTYPAGSVTYTSQFYDNPPEGATFPKWDWKILFHHQTGSYVAASVTGKTGSTNKTCTWTTNVGPLPSQSGYMWLRNADGSVQGSITVSGDDSQNFFKIDRKFLSYKNVPPPPPVPQLSFPSNNATEIVLNPQLKWLASSGASSYRLQFSRYNDFMSPEIDKTLITSTNSGTVISALLPNTSYYWRVSAKNNWGYSSFSAYRTFKTQVIPNNVTFTYQTVSGLNPIPEIKAHISITIGQSTVVAGGTATFKAGGRIDILNGVQVDDGSTTNIIIDPTLQ